MSATPAFPSITRAEIFERLAEGLPGAPTVVTANRRLGSYLKRAFDAQQARSGKSAWPTADVLPYHAFLERAWDGMTRADGAGLLLSPQQETALWERVIAESPQAEVLLNVAATARAARDAWTIRHAYRIDPLKYRSILDEDATAFGAWGGRYMERCTGAGWIDGARLPDAIAEAVRGGTRLKQRNLVLCGFDALSPQQHALFEALAAAGCEISEAGPAQFAAHAIRQGHADAEAEFMAVAQQVRDLLAENPGARIGVIVPELAARRADVVRILDDVLEPGRVLARESERARPFNISLGLPLSDYPVVHAAFLALQLARGELRLPDAGVLLRSPFIAAAEQEFAARALVDGELRSRGRNTVRSAGLLHAARGRNISDPGAAPRLAAMLEAWIPRARDAQKRRQPPSAWSATLLSLLKGLGWPGERTLDSDEYQTFEKFREVISELSALDPVTPLFAYDDALAALRRLAADTLFQPESPEVPVQVLGMLEAAGLGFDALFVTGMSDDAWPGAPYPNPFLPVSVQRALGVPHASAEWELQFARRATGQWLAAAGRVVFTYPRRDGDRELKPSPLIAGVPEAASCAKPVLLRDAVFAARRIETLDDFAAPPLTPGVRVTRGSQFFKNQAACPFRAFAAHRLGAAALESGHDGLDLLERGSLAHQAAANFWRSLGTHARLVALAEPELQSAIHDAVAAAIQSFRRTRPDAMTPAFAALEQTRVSGLLSRLVAHETMRAPFEVLATERPQPIRVAGLELNVRFDRVDRVAGGRIIIDYKTGRADTGDWSGDRPEEPQLPLYAVSGAGDVCGVSFVRLHAQEVAFKGIVRDTNALTSDAGTEAWKGIKCIEDWNALLEGWRSMLEALAREFLAGRAEVAPKRYPETCKHCDFGLLCRVSEVMDRGPVAPEKENGGD